MPKTNIDKQNKSELNNAVDRLVTRSNNSYEKEINQIASEYLDVLDSLTPEKISEKTGISSAAFTAAENISYEPGFEFPELLRLGALEFKKDSALVPGVIPWLHDFSVRRSLVINGFDSDTTKAMMQNMAFRILASIEPQLVHCHFIDPTGLGQHFSYLSQLSDVLKGTKILTEVNEIERVLAEAKAAAVNLVQEKLTHKYSNLKEYNAEAGSKLAEPYRCIFIANFPCGFNQKAIETLLSLISTAGKSGISVFISLNEAELSNYRNLADFPNSELPLSVISPANILYAADAELLNTCFTFLPEREVTPNAGALIDVINAKAMLAQSKTVDIDDLCTSKANKTSSAANVTIPVGLVGKENPCLLTLGSSKSGHHVLIGGATGSGKTVLLHNIIINGARSYEPDELVFYLLDYKEGTEFKCYEHLPHVQILSMESNRPFGLSVLQNLQEEIEKRGKLFKAAGVATLQNYKETTGQSMPRLLVIIDEFQVLLKERDRLSNHAAEILDDISRRGRSFGVHMILSTQTLSDVELKSSTMSNIAVRIGLRMSESDSIRLFHRDNTVAATLKKSGDAYYNAAHGQSEGNIRFQVAWLDVNKIEKLIAEIRSQFSERPEVYQHRYIMNGQTYAQFQVNRLERFNQQNQQHANHLYIDLLMAEPSFISQDAVSIRLRRQFSSNILAVGDAPADVTALSLLLLSQLVQYSPAGSHFYIVDLFAVDTPWYGKLHILSQRYPKQVTLVRVNQLSDLLDELEACLLQRAAADEPTTVRKVLWLLNTQAARIFDSSAGMVGGGSPATKRLEKIIKEGADSGIHVFLHCSQYQGLSKLFSSIGILKDFENCIALRGGDSQKLLLPGSQPIKSEGVAYVLSPRTRYEADPCRLYDPQQVLEHFQSIMGDEG
ncbi:FtsK/SpoIIIE domain-containing protein [Vibrio cholerae]|uniref:FtsK/SpoIIIE domain-containing protein n=2 Tax=Vibrio cholerae TaxID=666 RepID=UPI003B2235CC